MITALESKASPPPRFEKTSSSRRHLAAAAIALRLEIHLVSQLDDLQDEELALAHKEPVVQAAQRDHTEAQRQRGLRKHEAQEHSDRESQNREQRVSGQTDPPCGALACREPRPQPQHQSPGPEHADSGHPREGSPVNEDSAQAHHHHHQKKAPEGEGPVASTQPGRKLAEAGHPSDRAHRIADDLAQRHREQRNDADKAQNPHPVLAPGQITRIERLDLTEEGEHRERGDEYRADPRQDQGERQHSRQSTDLASALRHESRAPETASDKRDRLDQATGRLHLRRHADLSCADLQHHRNPDPQEGRRHHRRPASPPTGSVGSGLNRDERQDRRHQQLSSNLDAENPEPQYEQLRRQHLGQKSGRGKRADQARK